MSKDKKMSIRQWALVERDQQGKKSFIDLTDAQLKLVAKQGHSYALIDKGTNQAVPKVTLKRKGNSLLILDENGEILADLEMYFSQEGVTWSQNSSFTGVDISRALPIDGVAAAEAVTAPAALSALQWGLGGVVAGVLVGQSGSGNSAPTPQNTNQPFQNQPFQLNAVLHDDYIAYAQVFADLNGNGKWDQGEPLTQTDAKGNFKLEGIVAKDVNLIAVGGIDIASGVPNNIVYRFNLSGVKDVQGTDLVISPVSTLITAIAEALAAKEGTAITVDILEAAAEMLSQALNLGLDDANILLNIDAVKAAYSPTSGTNKDTGLDVLSLGRQISVVMATLGALVNGAAEDSSNMGTVVSARAIAEMLIDSKEDGVDFTDPTDLEKMLTETISLSKDMAVTQNLRATTQTDLKLIGQIIAEFNSKIKAATEGETSQISAESLAALVAVNDLMVPLLRNSGSEAVSERNGDISLATLLIQFKDVVANKDSIEAYVDDIYKAQLSSIVYPFGIFENVAGYVNEYVPLGLQLPAMSEGKIVDKIFLDLSELAAQTGLTAGSVAQIDLFRFDPLTEKYIKIAYTSSQPTIEVSPEHVGFLYIKTNTELSAIKVNGSDLFENKIEIPVRAIYQSSEGIKNFFGELSIDISTRPLNLTATVISVNTSDNLSDEVLIPHLGYSNVNKDPVIGGVLNQKLPAPADGRYFAIEIYEDSDLLGRATTLINNDRIWSFKLPDSILSDGLHTFTARVTLWQEVADGDDILVSLNSSSVSYSVVIDTGVPVEPEFDALVNGTLTGTSEPGTQVIIYIKAPAGSQQEFTEFATVTTDEKGNWTFTSKQEIPSGTQIYAYAMDQAGNKSGPTEVVTVMYPNNGLNSQPVAFDADDVIAVEGGVTIKGQLRAEDSNDDDALTFTLQNEISGLTLNPDGSWEFDASKAELEFLGEGDEYPIVVTFVVSDGFGGQDTNSFTITVKGTTPAILSVEPNTLRALTEPSLGETVTLEFIVSRDGSRDQADTQAVKWVLTGLSPSDFDSGVLPSGTVRFDKDSNTAKVLVEVPASLSGASLRQAVLTLDAPGAGYVVDEDNATASISIVNPSKPVEDLLVFTIHADQPAQMVEGFAGAETTIVYTVTRSGDAAEALSIEYRLDPVGAALISAQDFADENGNSLMALPAGVLVFYPNQSEASFTVIVRGDDAVGPMESFNLVLTGLPSGAVVKGQTNGEVINDDAYISVAPLSTVDPAQGELTHSFVVTRSGATQGSHSVQYTLQGFGEQASELFVTTEPLTLVFSPGEINKTVNLDDFIDSLKGQTIAGFQTFSIELVEVSGDNVTLVNAKAVAGIIPNLQDVEMSTEVDRIAEGSASEFVYTVSRSGAVDKALSLQWSVKAAEENGAEAADFVGSKLPTGVVTFEAGQTSATIKFKSGQDAQLEGDQGFVVQLNPLDLPPGVRILTPQLESFVVDDESAVGFAQGSAFSVVEGDAGSSNLMVEVTRIGFTGNESTVEWRVSPLTAQLGDFAAGQDLLGDNNGYPSGVLTLQPGEATGSVAIRIAGDTTFEDGVNETLSVTLSNPSEGTKLIGGSGPTGVSFAGYGKTTTATIENDDSQVQFESNRVSVTEQNGGKSDYVEITVTRTGSTKGSDTVKWSLTSIASGQNADNADIGRDNPAVGVFDQYQNSWIDIAHLKGSQTASGSVQITKSGYIMVAYNRDMQFDDDDDGNPVFDQFLLKNISLSGGGTLTALAPVTEQDFVASDAAVTGYGEVLFNNTHGLALPGDENEGRQIVISSKDNLAGVYFKVSGLDADGEAITEIIKGSNQGASSTAAYFSEVFKVETLAPGFAVGELDIPTDNYYYEEYVYLTQLKVSWDSGELQSVKDAVANNYSSGTAVRGASYESDMGFPVLQSEADLSDAVFVIKGGLAVAQFDSTHSDYMNVDFREGKGDYGQDDILKFDVAQNIRAEQVSGIFQGEDGSDEAQRFMVTGLNAAGEKISEILEVEDFEVNGLAEVNQYTAGNLIIGNTDFDDAGRIMISTNGRNFEQKMIIWSSEDFLNAFNLPSTDNVSHIYLRNIVSGSIERLEGTEWQSFSNYNYINIQDIVDGKIRVSAGMSGAVMEIEVRDNLYWNYNTQQINLIEPLNLKFTVTGVNAQGQVITETVGAPDFEFGLNDYGRDGDKATVATVKTFASVTSIVANQAFEGNIQIGVSKPVETVNKFTAIYGIAPVDEQGEYLDPQGDDFASSFAGRVEFKVPMEVTVQGPNAGVVVSPQVMNYIESIEVQRSLPDDLRVDIGFQEKSGPLVLSLEDIVSLTQTNYSLDGIDRVRVHRGYGDPVIEYNDGTDEDPVWVEISEDDAESLRRENDWPVEKMFRLLDPSAPIYEIELYDEVSDDSTSYYDVAAPAPAKNFIIVHNQDGSLTAEVNNNFEFNTDIRWETGNIFQEDQPNMGYAIFKLDAPNATVDTPVTLNFDIAQLGRYGFDVGRIAYAPDGTFSTTVRDMISDGQNALIAPLVAQEKMNVLTLSDFAKGLGDSGQLSIDPATITEVYIDETYSQAGWYFLTEKGWISFWDYTNGAENGSTISAQDIADGKLAYVGTWGRLDYEVIHEDGQDSAYFIRVDQKLDLDAFAKASVSSDLIDQIEINSYDNTDLVFNINPEGEAVWMDLWDYFDQQASSVISKQDILDGRIGVLAGMGDNFTVEGVVHHSGGQDEFTLTGTGAPAEQPMVVESTGVVDLPGDGYIWVRYANMFDGNDGADMAWINSLYVDNGATLTVVGRKALSDGIANSQQIAGDTVLDLNGVSVTYSMPDHSAIAGNLMMYISSPDIEKFDGLNYYYVGQDANGQSVDNNRYAYYFDGSKKPNDGMVRFLSMDEMGISNFERFTWDEETSSPQLWEPNFGVVKGSLNNLANGVLLVSMGEDLFDIDYDPKEFRPGAPVRVDDGYYDDSNNNYLPTEELLPAFSRSILKAQSFTEEAQSIDVAVYFQGAQRVTLTSTQDMSGRAITITGTDALGEPLVEVINGPDAGTVGTNAKFETVTGISIAAGGGSGHLSMGEALVFATGTMLAAYTSDGMPGTTFTMVGLGLDGEFLSVELNGTETAVTHPLGMFTEVWSVVNDGKASETLKIVEINAPQDVFVLDDYNEATFNQITDTTVDSGNSNFADWVHRQNYGLNAPAQLVFQGSPELIGKTVVFDGYSPIFGSEQRFELTIPESGVLVTPERLDYAFNFYIQEVDGSGQITLSWLKGLPPNADVALKASSDFLGELVLTGVDANGQVITRTVNSLEAGTEEAISDITGLIGYSYVGDGDAPDITLTSTAKYSFFQPITLMGERDENGFIALGDEKNVVITVKGSHAINQIIQVTGLVNGDLVTETLYGIADSDISVITKKLFTHVQKIEVGADDDNRTQSFSVGTVVSIIDEQKVSRYGGDMKLGEAVAVLESASKVTLTSTDNLSASEFTITGVDAAGQLITETIKGPNASTAISKEVFTKVLSIVASGDANGQIKVGYVTQAGAMVDDFVITGSGTKANPLSGHSTNTLEAYLSQGEDVGAIYSEADVLLYVDTKNALGPVKLHYDLAVQGSAAMGEDALADRLYVEYSASKTALLTGEVTFADGQSEAKIKIPVAGDDTREADESMTLTLTTASAGVTVVEDKRNSEITIVNDDDQVSLSPTAQSSLEGHSPDANKMVRFEITRLDSGTAKQVRWHLEGLSSQLNAVDNAADEDDFKELSGVVVFDKDALTATIEVVLVGDRAYEADETFRLVLSEPEVGSGYSLGANASALGTVTEDDVGIRMTAAPNSMKETDGQVSHTFTVTRVGDLTQASALRWSVSGTAATDDIDVTVADFGGAFPTNQVLNFAAGESSKTITVNTVGDNEMTGDRAFSVTLENASGDTSDVSVAHAEGEIIEDDAVNIAMGNLEIRQQESTGTDKLVTYTLTRQNGSQAASYSWQVVLSDDNQQASLEDFVGSSLPSGLVNFAIGETEQKITLSIAHDALVEADEAFYLRLQGVGVGNDVASQDITAYIVNDTVAYGIEVRVGGDVVTSFKEGDTGTVDVLVTFMRAGDSREPVSLFYNIEGTGATPLEAIDVNGVPLNTDVEVIFAAFESAVTKTLKFRADSIKELSKSFTVTLKDSNNTKLADKTIEVRDDDAALELRVDSVSIAEDTFDAAVTDAPRSNTIVYTVFRTGDTTRESKVDWRVKEGDGIDAADFGGNLPSGTIIFAKDDVAESKSFEIKVLKDSKYEGLHENLVVELLNASDGTQISTGSVTTRIDDDDKEVGFDVESVLKTVTEGSPTGVAMGGYTEFVELTYTVSRKGNARDAAQTIDWALRGVSSEGVEAAKLDVDQGRIMDVVGWVDGQAFKEGTLVFANNSDNTKQIVIRVLKDHYHENKEAFEIVLKNASTGLSIKSDSGVAKVLIEDDDNALVLDSNSATRVSRSEGQPNDNGDTFTEYTWVINRLGVEQAVDLNWQVQGLSLDLLNWVNQGGQLTSGATPSATVDDESDFDPGTLTGTLRFGANESTQTLTVRVRGDLVIESTEAFKVVFTKPDNVSDISKLGRWSVHAPTTSWTEGVIIRDEGQFGIVASELDIETAEDFSPDNSETLNEFSAKAEGDDGFVSHFFKIYREFTTLGDASVEWRVENGMIGSVRDDSPFFSQATNASTQVSDFVEGQDTLGDANGMPSGRATIKNGEAYVLIEVKTLGDRVAEDAQSFTVRLSNPSAGSTLSNQNSVATGYVADDDGPLFSIGENNPEGDNGLESASHGSKVVTEGDTVYYTVYRSGSTEHEAKVDWSVVFPNPVAGEIGDTINSTSRYTAGPEDFLGAIEGTLIFAKNESSRTIALQLKDDGVAESWVEAFTLELDNPRWGDQVPDEIKSSQVPAISTTIGALESLVLDANTQAPSATVAVTAVHNMVGGFEGTGVASTIVYTLTKTGTGAGQLAWKLQMPSSGDLVSITGDTNAVITEIENSVMTKTRDGVVEKWDLLLPNSDNSDVVLSDRPTIFTDIAREKHFFASGMVAFGDDETEKTITVTLNADSVIEANKDFVFTLIDGKTVLLKGFAEGSDAEGLGTPWDLVGTDGTDNSNNAGIFLLDAFARIPDSAGMFRDEDSYTVKTVVKNDDGKIVVKDLFSASVLEGDDSDQKAEYTASITRSGRVDHDVTVQYELLDLSLPVDQQVLESGNWELLGNPSITSGNASINYTKTFELGEGGNLAFETVPNKIYTVRLKNVSDPNITFNQNPGAEVGVTTRDIRVTLVNDDTVWSVSAPSAPMLESDADKTKTYSFTISRPTDSQFYSGAAKVSYRIAADEGAYTIDANDIMGGLGVRQVNFVAGQFSQTVSFEVKGDWTAERNETFKVELVEASQGVVHATDNAVTFTILNDDTTIEIVNAGSVTEGDADGAFLAFDVIRKGRVDQNASTVKWNILDTNTAQFSDLTSLTVQNGLSGILTFDSADVVDGYGESTQKVLVHISGDVSPETHETISVKLTNIVNDKLANDIANGTILNDDTRFSVTAGDVVKEGDIAGQMFTISRSHLTAQAQTVNWSIDVDGAGNQSAASEDFAGSMDGSVTFGSDEISKHVFVAFSNDAQAEFDETFTFTIEGGQGTSGDTIGTASAQGTIQNDDATLSVVFDEGKDKIREGSGSDTYDVEFVVQRNFNQDGSADVNWTLSGDAVDAELFAPEDLSGIVRFDAGETSQTVRVKVKANEAYGGDKDFQVILSDASGAQLLTGQGDRAQATIVDDDSTIGVRPNAQVIEGNANSNAISFVLDRTGSTQFASVVAWRVVKTGDAGDHATESDFTDGLLPSGTLVLAAGQSSDIVLSVPGILGDLNLEGDETFSLHLEHPASPDAGLTIDTGKDKATGTIVNNESHVVILDAVSQDVDAAGDDEGAKLTFQVVRTGYLDQTSTVNWVIVQREGDLNGTDDFVGSGLPSGTITFAAGVSEQTIEIDIRDEVVSELDEFFSFKLLSASEGTSIGASESFFKVLNDDQDQITLTADVLNLPEGDGSGFTPHTFTLTRGNAGVETSVDWSVEVDGKEPLAGEFEFASGTVVFAKGALTATIQINVKRDDQGGFDRFFDVKVSNVVTSDPLGAVLVDSSLSAVVQNDDPAYSVALTKPSFVEGSAASTRLVEFKIERKGDTTGKAEVTWTLSPDGENSTNIADFGGAWPSGVSKFNDGESLKTIQVALAPDAVFEPTEGFKVVLSNLVSAVAGAVIVTPSAAGTVTNDDTGVFVRAVTNEVREGESVDFTISAEGLPNRTVKVFWVVEGFGLSPANADDLHPLDPLEYDFDDQKQAFFTVLRLDSSGKAEASITVSTARDNVAGIDENFRLRVVEVEGGTIAQGRAEVTIQNDDSLVGISPASVVKSEGNDETTYTFTVTRTGNTSQEEVVFYTVEGFGDNPATKDDFVSPWSGSVVFAENSDVATITLTVNGDSDFESDESFVVRLSEPDESSSTQIEPSAAMAVGVIRNDDSASLVLKPLVSVAREGTETQNFLSYEIIRNGDNSEALEVNYVITGASEDDFDEDTGLSGTIVMEAGQSRAVLKLGIDPNSEGQLDRSFDVVISAEGFAPSTAVTGKILDDDRGIYVIPLSETSSEDKDIVFVVTRKGVNLPATTVDWTLDGLGDSKADDGDLINQAMSGSLVFEDGEESKQVVVKVQADNVAELTEALRLTLLSSTDNSQQILVSTADAYILDDDAVTSGDDVIQTGMGADRIDADDGDDVVYAGGGADRVYGGDGNDTIYAQGGADVVFGESGDDTVVLNSDNLAHFAESTDANSEGHAVTYVNGGTGDDTLVFEGVSLDIDLDHIVEVGGVRNFETIVLGDDDQTLALSIQSLVQMQTMRDSDDPMALHVTLEEGVDNAKVIFDAEGWTQSASLPGAAYVVWTHAELSATLHIDTKFYAD